ncbi:pseudouridylate synthase RPUSD4, mitochondrial-like [Mya arenaria]|uniref:pseudouridylate synthase RPUSD4, mitochondrial-like n=1 Tax=Mya arenaria TaxID=6604 RepID=UPI0022E930C2|nr:pseudouridylate synthase RPUSD4, mitochondrial-like [Mya arenaria]
MAAKHIAFNCSMVRNAYLLYQNIPRVGRLFSTSQYVFVKSHVGESGDFFGVSENPSVEKVNNYIKIDPAADMGSVHESERNSNHANKKTVKKRKQTINSKVNSMERRVGDTTPFKQQTSRNFTKRSKEAIEVDNSAYKEAMRIREKIYKDNKINLIGKMNPTEVDKDGNRILTNQVPQLERASEWDIVSILRKSIIYNDNDIVAITKPYGLPSHEGPGVTNCVGHFLDKIVPKTNLIAVHRLEKETTGVMVFAKTEAMADVLTEHFVRKRDIVKKYFAITKNIPAQSSGEIDIPLAEGTVDGKVRMTLRPYHTYELDGISKKRQHGVKAVTRYRTLDVGDGHALLECYALTGKKHQIRVHLAFGLNCPILGDHKYAHLNKIAPMRLHPDMLKMLKISQSGVRKLAMHLHARSLVIPGVVDGRNLFISAPMPPHFVRNMKDLKLKLPPHA